MKASQKLQKLSGRVFDLRLTELTVVVKGMEAAQKSNPQLSISRGEYARSPSKGKIFGDKL